MVHPFRFFNHNSTIVQQFHTHLDAGIRSAETYFNDFAANVDFPAFCLVYAIVLIWILRRINRQPVFRPKNKELVSTAPAT
jgi:hypothetical protein